MSVHPSNRLPSAAGDAVPSSAADPAGGGDLFNVLVSGLAAAGTGAPAAEGDAVAEVPAVEGTEPGAPSGKEVPESVAQLLALVGASRTHAAGKAKSDSPEADAKQEGPGSEGTADPQLPTPPAIAAATAPVPSTATAAAPPKAAPQGAPSPVAVAAAATAASPRLAALPTPVAAQRADAPAADASATNSVPAPQAAPALEAQPAAVPQRAATAAGETLSAAIKSLLAEIAAPGERDRAERPLPAEAAAPINSVAPRPIEHAAALNAVQAPLVHTQPQDSAQAAAPAAPLQGLVIERQLDLAHQQDWIDQLARDISTAAGGDGGSLRFRLNPEHLGTLHVEIAQSHHGAAVRFSADSEAARAIIADAQPRLVAEARAQGVRISEAHVDLGSGGSGDPRRQAAAPADVPLRTARSLQEEPSNPAGGGKPTPGPRELYA